MNAILGIDVFFWILAGCVVVLIVLGLILSIKPPKSKHSGWIRGSMS